MTASDSVSPHIGWGGEGVGCRHGFVSVCCAKTDKQIEMPFVGCFQHLTNMANGTYDAMQLLRGPYGICNLVDVTEA